MVTRFTAAILLCAAGVVHAADTTRLTFHDAVHNMPVHTGNLYASPPDGLTACPEVHRMRLFGRFPYRTAGSRTATQGEFLDFALAFAGDEPPMLLIDMNRDGMLGCDERLQTLTDVSRPGRAFRTVEIAWADRAHARRSRRRITVPRDPSGDPVFSIEIIDVPTASWSHSGEEALVLLIDGNADGMFDRTFGDGLVANTSRSGQVNLDPYSGEFRSFHRPFQFAGSVWEVARIDPIGRFVDLRVSTQRPKDFLPFKLGESTTPMSCANSSDGRSRSLGGFIGKHQLIYFWLSTCGTCWSEMAELSGLLKKIDGDWLSAVGVSLDGDRVDYDSFLLGTVPTWPQCFVEQRMWDNPIAHRYGVTGGSDFVLLDPEGRLIVRGHGMREITAALSAYLASDSLRTGG